MQGRSAGAQITSRFSTSKTYARLAASPRGCLSSSQYLAICLSINTQEVGQLAAGPVAISRHWSQSTHTPCSPLRRARETGIWLHLRQSPECTELVVASLIADWLVGELAPCCRDRWPRLCHLSTLACHQPGCALVGCKTMIGHIWAPLLERLQSDVKRDAEYVN